MNPDTLPRAPSRRTPSRRFVFGLAIVALLYAFAEIGTAIAFYALEGRAFSFATIHNEQRALHEGAALGLDAADAEALHPYLGFVANPEVNGTGAYFHDANDFGFFDESQPIHHRGPDRVIIAIVGGSFAAGFEQAGLETLTAGLRTIPDLAGKEFVFVRAAVQGYKQPQQLMTIAYLLSLGAEFDVVINLDGFNEVTSHPAENAAKGVYFAYPRNWFLRVRPLSEPGIRRLLSRLNQLEDQRERWGERFATTPLRYSVSMNFIWKTRDRSLAHKASRLHEEVLAYRPGENRYVSTGPTKRHESEAEMYADLVQLWAQSSLQLDRLCRANGIRYFHFLQPNQYVEGSKTLTEEERTNAFSADHPYRPGVLAGYPLLRTSGALLRDQAVSFTDLTMAFADVRETLYSDTCCHFTAPGYALLGEKIAGAIATDWATLKPLAPDGAAETSTENPNF